MIFEKKIKVNKQSDGTFTVSIMLSNDAVVVRTLTKNELQQLYVEIEQLLKD